MTGFVGVGRDPMQARRGAWYRFGANPPPTHRRALMTARTVSNLPAAMHVETARCLFAIELSKQSWVIGFITPFSAKISRRILSGCDWKGLLDLIEEVRAPVSRET